MDEVRVYRDVLVGFCADVFCKHGLSPEDGRAAAEVLVAADARGIPSHGVGRLWRYVNGLKDGTMLPDVKPEIVRETQSSLVLNAKGSMGAPVSVHAMKSIIEKARKTGAAFGCVRCPRRGISPDPTRHTVSYHSRLGFSERVSTALLGPVDSPPPRHCSTVSRGRLRRKAPTLSGPPRGGGPAVGVVEVGGGEL
jgi:hypothetical protein